MIWCYSSLKNPLKSVYCLDLLVSEHQVVIDDLNVKKKQFILRTSSQSSVFQHYRDMSSRLVAAAGVLRQQAGRQADGWAADKEDSISLGSLCHSDFFLPPNWLASVSLVAIFLFKGEGSMQVTGIKGPI